MGKRGYKEINLSNAELDWFYKRKTNSYDLVENEYLLIKDQTEEVVDKYIWQKDNFRQIQYPTISNDFAGLVKPRNIYQLLGIDMLQDQSTKVKLVKGVYGSGKDYLMLNQALNYLSKGLFQKIVYIRPNVTVANVPEIGFLKGDISEKLAWTLGPLYDKVGGQEGVYRMMEQGLIEMVPLLFIRGRSFENSIIYVSEGQNITSEIAKLIISRVGEGSQLWINADNRQTDNKAYEKDNGIEKMISKLSGNSLFGYVYLPITERGPVANLANLLDD